MAWQSRVRRALGVVGVGAAVAAAWSVVSLATTWRTERVPYTTVGRVEGVAFRRYPETVRVRTTADSQEAAFWRLFEYIDGANDGGRSVSMTAPVETATDGGLDIAMTAPVETARGEGVTMSFFLPASFTPETAPAPTDGDVELVVDPPRTLAVASFSWWAPRPRVALRKRRLLGALERAGVETTGDPRLLRYDPPWAAPWLRTNEVVVPVDWKSVRRALAAEREDPEEEEEVGVSADGT